MTSKEKLMPEYDEPKKKTKIIQVEQGMDRKENAYQSAQKNTVPWADIVKELTEEEYSTFLKWMHGQTVALDGPYVWDYMRWKREGKGDKQNRETWD